MILKNPLMSEKSVRLIEAQNTIMFAVDRRANKYQIKKELEEMFNVKVEKINTELKKNKKIAYIKLKKEFKAIDIATRLGLM